MVPPYVELQVTTNFSFLRGASHAEELAATAAVLGHAAIAIADRNSLAGVVRAHAAARAHGIPLVVGARLDLEDAPSLLCFPIDRAAYGRLSRLLTLGKRRAEKGQCRLTRADITDPTGPFAAGRDQIVVIVPSDNPDGGFANDLKDFADVFGDRCYLAAHHLYRGDDARRLASLAVLGNETGVPLVATNDVHFHVPDRRPLADVLICIREGRILTAAGRLLTANAERHLKPAAEMARLFRHYPDAVARTADIAARCHFDLEELRYEYPADPIPDGLTADGYLAQLTWDGAAERYPGGISDKVRAQLAHELELIAELAYAPYFLTVHDIVRFARSRDILCQGRGSAANSAVCYALGITAVDPDKLDLLFARFVSAERNEPPDIDVDFEHERREEVIQYVYAKYGRERAGLAATVISYRARSAVREVGKALGLSEDTVGVIAGQIWGWSSDAVTAEQLRDIGLDPDDATLRHAIDLSHQLIGFPRHLSQHVGGFVITKGRLDELVPIENAAMKDRTVIEWDKDDLDTLGILKIDVLALGMLTCVRKAFDLLELHYGRRLTLATVPTEDPAVYDMLCSADSLGVFQVESRAQMAFLPRMKPRNFYDLVIEVAIVRPGPIQGDMVHPYLRRRNGEEQVDYPSRELREVLSKTLGVPLFQEQAMKIAIVGAGFTPGEADELRRAMATFRRAGTIHTFHRKMIDGMKARDYPAEFAERCFRQIEGFGEYGFPESHAASFALLVYVSSWIKCHYPEVFAAALINSQPMGFYAPAQIVRDAREHNVDVRPPDVDMSDWDCTLEPTETERRALRLGFRQIKGFKQEDGERIAATRPPGGFGSPRTLWRRAELDTATCTRLADADAFRTMGLARRAALWAVRALDERPLPLFAAADGHRAEPEATLPRERDGEAVANDYATLRLSLKHHPLALLREEMAHRGVVPNERLVRLRPDRRVTIAGLVLVRQRPGSAKGVIFATLEDETGTANVIVWPDVFARFRRIILASRLLLVRGQLQREGIVIHIIAHDLVDLSDRLDLLAAGVGEVHPDHARDDEITHPGSPDAPNTIAARPPRPRPIGHPRNQHIRIQSHDFH